MTAPHESRERQFHELNPGYSRTNHSIGHRRLGGRHARRRGFARPVYAHRSRSAHRRRDCQRPPAFRHAALWLCSTGRSRSACCRCETESTRTRPKPRPYLVEGKPSYFGGFAKFNLTDLPHWGRLADVVRSGDAGRRRHENRESVLGGPGDLDRALGVSDRRGRGQDAQSRHRRSDFDPGRRRRIGRLLGRLAENEHRGHLDAARLVKRQSGGSRVRGPTRSRRAVSHDRRRLSHDRFRRVALRPGDLLPHRPRRAARRKHRRVSQVPPRAQAGRHAAGRRLRANGRSFGPALRTAFSL